MSTIQGWDTTLWATVLAVTCLTDTDLKVEKDSWELVVNKAQKWMTQYCRDADLLQSMIFTSSEVHTKKC